MNTKSKHWNKPKIGLKKSYQKRPEFPLQLSKENSGTTTDGRCWKLAIQEKKGEIMLNNWNEEDFQKALSNHERMLKERPGDADLLLEYQMISLEYERYKKEREEEQTMLSQLKQKIEARIGEPVNNGDLLTAIEMAKSDVVANRLVMGQDVTVQMFEDAVVNCFRTYKKRIAM